MAVKPMLLEIIRAEIARSDGRITFARYMELALYHPQHGYYTARRERDPVGRDGDFFTSVSVGPLFGRILATQFVRYREALGNPAEFQVVECGGRTGQLRADILQAVPDLDYPMIEANDPLPDRIVGCVFSNELLDALPVHRVGVRHGQWIEWYVTDNLTEEPGPLSDPRLAGAVEGLPVGLMEGYRTEINLRALDWIADVARRLTRGFVLTIDYGFERTDYFAPHRQDGHLQCYHRHTRNADPFDRVGEQDITAHVEFTSVIERGRACGLELVTFTDQAHFLLEAGEDIIREIVERTAGQLSKERAAIHQLIHPGHMGRAFKVLVQRKP
jgi:SAM-dependent MidA family methyltransferase